MGKTTGMGDRLLIDGVDISGDTNSVTIMSPVATLDATDITMSNKARLLGLGDGDIEWVSFFNPALGAVHPTLDTLPTTDRIVTYLNQQAIGNAGASMVAKQLNYDPTRAADGAFTFKVHTQANDQGGLEWGDQLTAGISTITTAGTLASVDYGATIGTTAFGAQAFLQVTAVTGTSGTVAVQHSNDDGAVDPYANVTGLVFNAASAAGAQRAETGRTASIKRYLRASVTGTFTSFSYVLVVTKNLVASRIA